ncbi:MULTISPECIES: hypothetical protein [Acidithiobacillus]|jgi:hypothetical protein|uniref:hypothetical protein n=1 Tax=Acidithiobacillus ferrooxidans TaxID=920 RepID=UPI000A6DDDE5|nr:hypothetical protein [Acidithiobacillus ferrooxidans]
MFDALILVGLMVIATVGGKASLLMLASQPLIGPVAAWCMGYVGQVDGNAIANLIYGAMALQLSLMALAPVLYGPPLVHKAVACYRARRVGVHN